ncbi:MAG: AAA family ATPase [Candidatus Aminicenantes bacterium]|nr:AAA family ATPase [Candidatus Aminicenantes bacterium]
MIRRIEALNYRCLHYVDVRFEGSFHILVGPNASGKSTLLDVIGFLGDLIRDGLDVAIDRRTRNFQDLVWDRPRKNPGFQVAVEFDIPEALENKLPENEDYRIFRYEVSIQEGNDGPGIASERGFLGNRWRTIPEEHPSFDEDPFSLTRKFPSARSIPKSILTNADDYGYRPVLQKSANGKDTFKPEILSRDVYFSGSESSFTFGRRRSTLKNLPEDREQFPVATYVKRLLESGIQKLFLDSRRLRRASSPNSRRMGFVPDGSNLPWAIQRLSKIDPVRSTEWLDHVRTALREIEDIRVVEREDDRHAYLMLRYATGVEVPSWTVSDGTLRLLALTLAAYLPDIEKIYLLEEPENGIHPMAVETVYQSLSSVYDSQVLVATHSPVFLSCAEPKEILCFAKNDEGATDIIAGHQHPRLADWRSSADVDLLFASEVFG